MKQPEKEVSIEQAQAKLERVRERLGIAPPTIEEAQWDSDWRTLRRVRQSETLQEMLARFKPTAPRDESLEERTERVALARLDAGVPDSFTVCPKGCAWATPITGRCSCGAALVPVSWKTLPDLIGPEGWPALGGIEVPGGKILGGAMAVSEIRRHMAGEPVRWKIVLLGNTRAGKSITAAAFVDGQIRSGAERVRWTSAIDLQEPGAIHRAMNARTTVIDDVGEELFGASKNTGLVAQRSAPFAQFVGAWARTRGKRLVLTTYLPFQEMADLYGAGVAARCYEGAMVLRFQRLPQ